MRGAKPGERRGGRTAGTANKKTREIADKAAASGITPLEYMLEVMRDPTAKIERRDHMAVSAASFMHPRLATTVVKGDGPGGSIPVSVSVKFVSAKCRPAAKR